MLRNLFLKKDAGTRKEFPSPRKGEVLIRYGGCFREKINNKRKKYFLARGERKKKGGRERPRRVAG
jgi:hypothetical protein